MKKEILRSLQEESIWIVPDDLKNEYERLLIEYSDNHAILFQKVSTIRLYYEELLKKHEYFSIHKITQMDKIKVMIQLLHEGNYQYLKIDQLSDVIDMINTMQDHCIHTFPNVDELPLFTKDKLKECYEVYCRYLDYLKKEYLFDHNYDIPLEDHRKVYVAGFAKLTASQKRFLDQLNVTYVEEDHELEKAEVTSFLNPQLEIEACLHDIVVKVNQGATLNEFMLYVPTDQHELLQQYLYKYHIPYNGNENIQDEIYHTLRLMNQYIVSLDPQVLIEIMYLTSVKEMVWDYDRRLKTGNLKKRISIERMIRGIEEYHTMKDITNYIISLMKQLHLNRYESFGEAYNYISSYDQDIPMTLTQYFNIVLSYYPTYVHTSDALYAINYQGLGSIAPTRKYTYILGCNEEKFPNISKDKGLLLNDGKRAFGIPDLIDEIENQKKVINSIVESAKYLHLSYPTSTNAGDTLLKSTYLDELEKKYSIEKVKYSMSEIASIEAEKRYLLATNHPEVEDVHLLSKQYEECKNQPAPVIIQKERDLSVSEIETYNGCPFKYYMSYGLKVREWKNRMMAKNDYGSLRHDIVEACSEYINGNEQDIDLVIHLLCEQYKKSAEDSNEQAYYFEQIEKQMKTTVRILKYQNLVGNYTITGHEVDVREECENYAMHGRFDRKDTFNQYARVIDYKSSNKVLDVDLARLGFNIQMLLYLSMLDEQSAGVLYFNMATRVVKNAKLNKVELKQLYKEYRMNGLVVDDASSLEAMNIEHVDHILPIRYTKKGISGSIITRDELDQLLDDIHQRVQEIVDGIFEEGNIQIEPATSNIDKINHIVDPCTYCDYRNVCLLDIFYQSGREIKIGGELADDEVE